MSESTTLTSKGQLVIPKAVRERLQLRPGDVFRVSVSGRQIVLDTGPAKTLQVQDWLPGLQIVRDVDVAALCNPVERYED
jgi:AbrB family looped-hinge helix DNA binding protein